MCVKGGGKRYCREQEAVPEDRVFFPRSVIIVASATQVGDPDPEGKPRNAFDGLRLVNFGVKCSIFLLEKREVVLLFRNECSQVNQSKCKNVCVCVQVKNKEKCPAQSEVVK